MTEKTAYTIDIVDVTLRVLECLTSSGGKPLRASEIADQLDINRTRVFRILKTLEARGYSEYDPASTGFRLGLKFLDIGKEVLKGIDLRKDVEPFLVSLAQRTGDSAYLLVRHGLNATIIDRHMGGHALQVHSFIGQSLPLHVGASPKILLAYAAEADREQTIQELTLARYTENTITSRFELQRRLEAIRAQGYALDEEDYEIGCFSVGAPVFDASGSVIAGISISIPKSRYNSRREKELVELVTSAGRQVSARMGWNTVD